ncbi:sialidase-like [Portunus trituberculatus]|uniref:sialidase-like n=1 Tax=Portunus trituberculatus TaxID=210409 RepID=UPI001E1D1FC9|nr:sialidase-like [Portunus trituberculatus]XP_045116512.1 sialidase-like [Portunus trituberculatus]
MDPFLTNARQFFQGLPTSTRGYDGSSLEDTTHAPPTPTPPATPTLPPAHGYYPYQVGGSLVGAAPPTSLPGQLPQSRPITPATPSHKPLDHTPTASPYNVSSFLQPPSTKPSANDSRYLSHLDHMRQVSASAPSRQLNPVADARAASRSYSSQPSLVMDGYTSQVYSTPSTLSHDSLHTPRSYSTQAPSALEPHLRPYGLQQAKAESRYLARHLASSKEARTHATPFSAPTLAPDPRMHHLDNKYSSKTEARPDLRGLEVRPDPRPDYRHEPWPPVCRAPEAKALERLATSVHTAAVATTVNGSKDALYLGRRLEELPPTRHGDDPYRKAPQVNGSRDPLYANGSHTAYPAPPQRETSSERPVDPHPKEDLALDLSVKTVRQTPDSTAPDPEKSGSGSSSSSTSPLSSVSSDRLAHSEAAKCSSSSIPLAGSGKVSKGPSPVPKATHSLSGLLRATPPSHVPSPYGINGTPSLMPNTAAALARVPHMLAATKRPGDPSYPDSRTKMRRSSSPAGRAAVAAAAAAPPPAPAAHHPPSAHYPPHLSDKMLYGGHREAEHSRGLNLLAGASLISSREAVERRQPSVERRDPVAEWRKDSSAFERRAVREVVPGRSDLAQDRREVALERKGTSLEKWPQNAAYEAAYPLQGPRDL